MIREYGSDFHSYLNAPDGEKSTYFDSSDFSFFFSGRVALYNLLAFGIKKYNWKKIGFPSYYCHEVVDFCRKLPAEIVYYNYNPFLKSEDLVWDDRPDHVFINVDFFGIVKCDTSLFNQSVIIDDLTHNLLSIHRSNADYCFASLRKQLPVPAGGFCFSRKGDLDIRSSINVFADKVALQKLSAMYLKSEYLQGNFQHKDVFRALFVNAEEQFESFETNAKLPELVRSQLFSLPVETLLQKTYQNIRDAKRNLHTPNEIAIMGQGSETAMGLLFLCENSEIRDRFKTYLVQHNIYPAILWPRQFNHKDIDLQDRFLFVHCDFRYNDDDVDYITQTINNFCKHV